MEGATFNEIFRTQPGPENRASSRNMMTMPEIVMGHGIVVFEILFQGAVGRRVDRKDQLREEERYCFNYQGKEKHRNITLDENRK